MSRLRKCERCGRRRPESEFRPRGCVCFACLAAREAERNLRFRAKNPTYFRDWMREKRSEAKKSVA